MGSIPITRSILTVAGVTDWLAALIGGALIGLAATLLLWSIGRAAGVATVYVIRHLLAPVP